MSSLISFLSGSGMLFSLAVFVFGMLFRFVWYFKNLNWKLDRVAYSDHMSEGMKGGLYSAFRWLIPFGTHGWRAQPFVTVAFFLLHVGAVLVPLFLLAHQELLQAALGFSLPTIGQGLADFLTVLTIVGVILLAMRRLSRPEVRILTNKSDWLIIALVVIPFVSGLAARMLVGSSGWLLIHLLSGNLFLILAPFTKLSHIVLYFASRWQIGADYAIKRGGRYRGALFPW